MDVVSSLKKRCDNCQFIRRRGIVFMICTDPNHKARQRGQKRQRRKVKH